jgi:hypothetical protein
MKENAAKFNLTPIQAELKAKISLGVLTIIGIIFLITYFLIHKVFNKENKNG